MNYQIMQGDCLETMRGLPSECIQTCITSPPYYGLRDYGHEGQIGLEQTPDEYISKLVDVFREVRRLLKPDGTLWLNLGDSYNGSGGPGGWADNKQTESFKGEFKKYTNPNRQVVGLKPKDLIGIPWMAAFALRADGWFLRADIIWHKPNPMPESVTDRPTKAHEYIFLLSKDKTYYYNADAISEDTVSTNIKKFTDNGAGKQRGHGRRHAGFNGRYAEKLQNGGVPSKRNRRSVWTIATRPYSGAHFATFPTDLIQPCILAGSKPGDIVLDPFNGSGTTGAVALKFGRNYIGCEINPHYIELAHQRIQHSQPMLLQEVG